MSRGKKALYNSLSSILVQIVSIICGFILPRMVITTFGSAYNGITSSVGQFISVVALLRAGVGGATRASLYKSLANKDTDSISATIKATEQFMRKVSFIFLVFIFIFAAVYPYLVKDEFEWFFTFTLVLIISISTFVQYFFGITYQMLLQADQKQYISLLIEAITTALNTVISIILIKLGFGIHAVKLGSAFAFSITPICLNLYAKKHYALKKNIKPDYASISQRWDAFFHQIAAFINNNTDITLLTFFCNIKVVSVYTTYYLVGSGIRKIISTCTVGIEAAFGNMMAKKETSILNTNVKLFENFIHIISCILFGSAYVLITPFVQVYTKGVTDINYSRYLFGYLVITCELLYCLRSPYQMLIQSAGHFKQTKKYAFIEATLNLLISLLFVKKFNLIGVSLGTLVALTFRNIVYSTYSSKHIIHRKQYISLLRYIVSFINIIVIYLLTIKMHNLDVLSYINWIILATKVTIIAILSTITINLIFYKKTTIQLLRKIVSILYGFVNKQ